MNVIKGTSPYWKKVLFDVLSMVTQRGVPTSFMSLSFVDLRWNELITIISKLDNQDFSDEDIQKLTYHERWKLLSNNPDPVLITKSFQNQFEVFFKEIIFDSPLKKLISHVFWVEFQVRGSLHIHFFL